MRNFLIVLALFGLVACGGDEGKTNVVVQDTTKKETPLTPEQKITMEVNAAMEKSLTTPAGSANPKLVASFEFGMSKETVEEHTQKMMKKGALKKVKKGSDKYEYVYQLPIAEKLKTDTYMEADYKDGALYKLVCNLKTPAGMGTADILAQAKLFLEKLYGTPAFTLPSYNSCDHYLWINGKMHIDLRCELEGARFVYTDLQSEKPAVAFNPSGTQVDVSDVKHN